MQGIHVGHHVTLKKKKSNRSDYYSSEKYNQNTQKVYLNLSELNNVLSSLIQINIFLTFRVYWPCDIKLGGWGGGVFVIHVYYSEKNQNKNQKDILHT